MRSPGWLQLERARAQHPRPRQPKITIYAATKKKMNTKSLGTSVIFPSPSCPNRKVSMSHSPLLTALQSWTGPQAGPSDGKMNQSQALLSRIGQPKEAGKQVSAQLGGRRGHCSEGAQRRAGGPQREHPILQVSPTSAHPSRSWASDPQGTRCRSSVRLERC